MLGYITNYPTYRSQSPTSQSGFSVRLRVARWSLKADKDVEGDILRFCDFCFQLHHTTLFVFMNWLHHLIDIAHNNKNHKYIYWAAL